MEKRLLSTLLKAHGIAQDIRPVFIREVGKDPGNEAGQNALRLFELTWQGIEAQINNCKGSMAELMQFSKHI